MSEGAAPVRGYAPVPVVAATTLLWIQGAIWAALGSLDVAFCPEKAPLNDLLITVFFGFTALSAALGVLLPHPGRERIRAAVVAQQWFMTALGLTVLLALAAFPVLLVFTPGVGGFALAGSIMAACAAGGLRSGSARAFCRPGAATAVR
jgi:hypothetical protein